MKGYLGFEGTKYDTSWGAECYVCQGNSIATVIKFLVANTNNSVWGPEWQQVFSLEEKCVVRGRVQKVDPDVTRCKKIWGPWRTFEKD